MNVSDDEIRAAERDESSPHGCGDEMPHPVQVALPAAIVRRRLTLGEPATNPLRAGRGAANAARSAASSGSSSPCARVLARM